MSRNNLKHVAFAFVVISSISFLINYYFLLGKKENQVQENANKINAILSENFEQAEKMLIFVGRKIERDTPDLDIKIIHKIFVQTFEIYGTNNALSWSLFDWIDLKGYETVSTMLGIRSDAPYLAPERSYFNRSNEPWKVIFSKAAVGNPSGVYIIPVGVQIETKKHLHAGSVVAGIGIKKLTNLIKSQLDNGIRFALVDKRDGKFVFGYYEPEKYLRKTFYDFPQLLDDERYIYKQDMAPKYPYDVLVGYDAKDFWREVCHSSLLLMMQIIGVIFFTIYFSKKLK